MTMIGYARVSTLEQNLDVQRKALSAAGCNLVLEEHYSGKGMAGREKLDMALAILREGDTLVVTKLDRLSRSLADLAALGRDLQARGVHLKVLDQPIDTSTSAGRAFFGMLATFAQFEYDIRAERQREGIKRAKEGKETRPDGSLKYAGGKPTINRSAVLELLSHGVGPTEITRRLKVSRQSVYRIAEEEGYARP